MAGPLADGQKEAGRSPSIRCRGRDDEDGARGHASDLLREIAPQRGSQAPLLARPDDDQGRSFLRGDLGEPFSRISDLDSLLSSSEPLLRR
jgi:hypothetical protein